MLKHYSIYVNEVTTRKSQKRNPKLYDGNYISLVRRADGSLKFFFKELKPETDLDLYADQVYSELDEAIENIL